MKKCLCSMVVPVRVVRSRGFLPDGLDNALDLHLTGLWSQSRPVLYGRLWDTISTVAHSRQGVRFGRLVSRLNIWKPNSRA